jgi:hypothetical protein
MITIISIENVLARGEDLKTAQPTKQAKQLYDGLRSQNNTVGFTRADEDIARWWLKREHLDQWSSLISYPPTSPFPWDGWCVDQVRGFLAEGWEIFAYVDKLGPVLVGVDMLGVATIGVTYPSTAVGWKEVAAPRAWADIATTVDAQTP